MLDAKQVIAKMNERGFSESMRMVSGTTTTCITFATMRLDGTDISCTVNLEEETFAFMWCIPCSINRISTPPCSPVLDDNQFNRIYRKIFKHVRLLYLELENEGEVPC